MRKNTVNAEYRDRQCQYKCRQPRPAKRVAQYIDQNTPCQNGCQTGDDRGICDVMPIDGSPKLDDPRLDQKRKRCIRKRKIGVRPIAERHSICRFEHSAQIIEDGDPRILPDDDRRCRPKQKYVSQPFGEDEFPRAAGRCGLRLLCFYLFRNLL